MPNIGRYEIESRIGRGGMGDVYRAYDPTLRRRVAIKVLKVEGDSETLNRFRLEATAAGNLNHPNIVTVHDYGVVDNEPYLVMEYLEGQDLQRTIETGKKFDLVEITDIMSQVSDSLECAHQHGVIHRDVKPANIMLLAKGGVKLMDFGIARLAGSNTQHTKAGHLIGTVLYMSPEQFHNMELDLRVDIWAFGVIYYELLAGKHPFQVPDQIVTMYNIANKPAPPICSVNKEVPEALGQIVDRCLTKDRDQRYRSMEDLRYDVLPVLQDLSKQQAGRMLSEARLLMEQSDWDSAQPLIRRVLELDPANRAAGAMRKAVADALKKREIGPRIDSLSNTAQQHIAAKEFAKALNTIETGLRLDPAHTLLLQRKEEVKELIEREKRAEEEVRLSKAELETQNLTEAYRHAAEALRHDPRNSEGTRLLASLQEELAKRERQRSLDDGLMQGRHLLKAKSFDDAVTLLQGLAAEFPGTLEAAQLLREAENARQEAQKQRRLQDELANVKELLRLRRFGEAVPRLEALISAYPGQTEVQEQLRCAREEWKIQQRAEALDRLRDQIAKLQNEGRFEEAIRFLERSQVEFPDEPDLQRLTQSVMANKAEAERRAALERTMLDARGKHRSGEITEALRLVDLGLREHGPDEPLNALRTQLELDWEKLQRTRAIEKAIGEGRQFLERHEWEKAIAHFQTVTRQYPEEQEPRQLLAESETWLKREQRQRTETEALARVAALDNQGQKEAALAEVETVLQLLSDSAPLTQARERLQREIAEKKKTHERQLKIDEARRKAQEEQKRREREEEEAAEKLRIEQAAKLEDFLGKAYLAIGQGDLRKAAKTIAEAQKVDSHHPGVQRALSDLEAEQTRIRRKTTERATAVAQAAAHASANAPTVPSKPFPVKAVAIGALTAVALAAGAFFYFTPKPPGPAEIPLETSPQSVELAFKAGGAAPGAVNIVVKGKPGSDFAAKPSAPWISIAPEQGTLPATIVMTARPDGLAAGPHMGSVDVESGQLTSRVAVSLTVPPPPPPRVSVEAPRPEFKVFPEFLPFTWVEGSPDPPAKPLYLSGSGGATRYQAVLQNGVWASVNQAAGSIPGQILVTVHPRKLPSGRSGSYSNQVIVTSPDVPGVKFSTTIKMSIAEPPHVEPAESKQPPQENPPPSDQKKIYGGRRSGDMVWSGTIAPGATVVIMPGIGTQGGGNVIKDPIPRDVAFGVTSNTPGVQASAALNSLTLTNTSGMPVLGVTVHWAVK